MSKLKKKLKEIVPLFEPNFVEIKELRRLSGGSSNESWLLILETNNEDRYLVFRRTPDGKIKDSGISSFIGINNEAKIMNLAYKHGVPVPKIHHIIDESFGIGKGFFMEYLEGLTVGNRIVRDHSLKNIKPTLASQCGKILSMIHQIPIENLIDIPISTANNEINKYEEVYLKHGNPHPVFDLAFKWLRKNIPHQNELTLVHGDFRNGNLIIHPKDGISGVLDWEILHLGDPYEDLSWICVNSWRYNNINLPVGGFGSREDMYIAYEKSSGKKLDRERAKYWEILGTLKWGIMCLNMIEIYRSGFDKSIDRVSIGRRSSETEIDLIRLLLID